MPFPGGIIDISFDIFELHFTIKKKLIDYNNNYNNSLYFK